MVKHPLTCLHRSYTPPLPDTCFPVSATLRAPLCPVRAFPQRALPFTPRGSWRWLVKRPGDSLTTNLLFFSRPRVKTPQPSLCVGVIPTHWAITEPRANLAQVS